jgi:hypothetical protein
VLAPSRVGVERGRGCSLTLETSNDDAERIQLPSMPHPSMECSRGAPEQHAAGDPGHHAISAAQSRPERLQSHEEGEEEGQGRVDVALAQPNVGGEVGRLGVPYLRHLAVSDAVGREGRATGTDVGLVEGVEEEQQGQEGQQQTVELHEGPPM